MALFDSLRRKRRKESPTDAPASYPDGQRMYCIGDIHGRADLLEELHRLIEEDAETFIGHKQLLYLGDYIDRGENSRKVIDMLITEPILGWEHIHLLGNHEHALLDFLIDPQAMASWLQFGGVATLQSYGIEAGPMPSSQELAQIRDLLERAMPAIHKEFLEQCTLSHTEGDYYFVHAGIRPGVALDKQDFQDQLWLREPFLSSTANHGAVIVHGHSIKEQVELLPNRIGIDTGAYYTEVLTCLVLEGQTQRLLQTGAEQ